MASLADQLKQIAAQNPFLTNLKSTKRRPSYLFTAEKAGDLDMDTVFAIGVNGFLELCQIDARFLPFEETLFSESFKTYDRTLKVHYIYTGTGSSPPISDIR